MVGQGNHEQDWSGTGTVFPGVGPVILGLCGGWYLVS